MESFGEGIVMEKLIIERTTPIQGEPVNIYFTGSRGKSGQLILSYEEWLHFNKLLKEGMDSLKRKNETRIELVIKGIHSEPVKEKKASFTPIPKALLDEAVKDILKPEIDLDKEDEKAIVKAENEQKLVRSLLPEVESDKVD